MNAESIGVKISPELLLEYGITPEIMKEKRGLLPPGAKKITDEQLAYVLLMGKRWFRLCNIYKIKNDEGHIEVFRPNPQQKYLFDNTHYLNLILKSRQHGVTTFLCILFLDICMFQDNVTCGIIAQTEGYARFFFDSKVKFAYDNLPPEIKAERKLISDRNDLMKFSSGSTFYVDCSMRSGTLNYLHVSEFGEVCATRPDKAQEIVAGALNTVAVGQFVFIEATGKGSDGYFYDYCQESMKLAMTHTKLNALQFKFFFLGWYCKHSNVLPADSVVLTKEDEEYFAEIEPKIRELSNAGIIMPMPDGKLSPEQKAWYAQKKQQQKDNMLSEFPATPEEAFKNTAEGCYYRVQFTFLRSQKESRICRVSYEPGFPVNTGFDFGLDDYTAIWFHQKIRSENRLIHYFEDYGEGLEYYVQYMQNLGYHVWGTHYLPHDGGTRRQNAQIESYQSMLGDLGLRNIIVVPRTQNILTSIQEVRNFLPTCWIDESDCAPGIKALENFRKDYNDRMGKWKDTPRHDENSHGEAAMRSLACGLSMMAGRGNKSGKFIKERKKPDMSAFGGNNGRR